jgi:hypothetical protein
VSVVACGCLGLVLVSCSEPPNAPTKTSVSAEVPASARSSSSGSATSVASSAPGEVAARSGDATVSAAVSVSASAAPSVDPLAVPEILGPDGATLPQTKDRPSATSPAFERRMKLLWEAIVANDPSRAERVFFPREAYEVVKDIEKPGADWKHRLMKAFARNVGEYHKKLGGTRSAGGEPSPPKEGRNEPESLIFEGIDLDEKRVKWIDKGEEGNKVGYWRVTRSKLRYRDPAGKSHTLELTSLISWRGEWFVVHLHGFK